MAATASITIVVDDSQATQAFANVDAASKQAMGTMTTGAGNARKALDEVTPALGRIGTANREGREAAVLLTEEMGVRMPRALANVLSDTRLIGPALQAAFSGVTIFAFVELAKQAFEQLTGMGAAMTAIQKANDAMMQSIGSANKILMGPQNLKQVTTTLMAAEKNVDALNGALGLTGDLIGDSLKTGLASKFSASGAIMVEQLSQAKHAVDQLYVEQARLIDEQRRTEPVEILRLQNKARLAGLQGIAQIDEAERGQTKVIHEEINKQITDA